MGFSIGASLAFFRPSANLRASTSSFVFSASTVARNFASTASVCFLRRCAVSSRSMDGGLTGATCASTAPSSRSTVIFAPQQGQSISNTSCRRFPMSIFYASSRKTKARSPCGEPDPSHKRKEARHGSRASGVEANRYDLGWRRFFALGQTRHGPRVGSPRELRLLCRQGGRSRRWGWHLLREGFSLHQEL